MGVTIRQIEAFLAVAELGNFSRAAERLKVAQPALSQAVKDLESALGALLFDRTTRRVELTDAGKEFRDSAAKVLEGLELAIDGVHDLAERRRGRLRISAPPLLATVVLPQAVAEFARQFPGVEVRISDVGTKQIVDEVRSGRADCGLGTFAPGEDGIERKTLMRDSLMLFSGTKDAFRNADGVRWNELENRPIITLTRESSIRLLVEVGFETHQIPFKPIYEVTQVATAIAFVEAGLGVAILPTYALAAARHRAVVGRPMIDPTITRDIVLLHASGRSMSPAVSAFYSIARRYAQKLFPKQASA